MNDGLYPHMDEPTYFGSDALSSSGIKDLLKSPAHFKQPGWFSEAADLGSAFHTETLGVGQEVVVVDAASWRGKDAGAAQQNARDEGKAPILTKDVATVRAMAEAVRNHPAASALLNRPGQPELSAFWTDPVWDVQKRARTDYLTDDGIVIDLKSTTDVARHKITRSVLDFGYHISEAHYRDVLAGLDIDVRAYALIFVTKTPPYSVRVVELSADFVDLGRRRVNAALEIYRDCIAADSWPSYDNPDFTTLHPPEWAREDTA